MLKLVQLSKRFIAGDLETTALDAIDLEIAAGEYVAITGPSGCGKSTLLGILGMLDAASGGEYWFDQERVVGRSEMQLNAMRRGRIGFVFQNFNLIEEFTVRENIELALRYSDVARQERQRRVDSALEQLGIAHRAQHRPPQLSGGQQQRVAIARAMVARPSVLLADEPTGNLDSVHGAEVMRILDEIHRAGTTIVMVTHSAEHAARAMRRVQLRDGRVVSDDAAPIAPAAACAELPS